ncbi:hypothetical protein EVAR_67136_1 [Eumeta japonica]|uniref:Uncharacterized protein n=1 Tax=Eumeta variegata TaxID=151549 RepID=A0A4C1ZWW9_EUMVA|nr:hypothetical protein EVAR_67136_1 [Eumeta japonica]
MSFIKTTSGSAVEAFCSASASADRRRSRHPFCLLRFEMVCRPCDLTFTKARPPLRRAVRRGERARALEKRCTVPTAERTYLEPCGAARDNIVLMLCFLGLSRRRRTCDMVDNYYW